MAGGALLTSLRVLDVSTGDGDAVGRIFADLGADVLKVEPPGGSAARHGAPSVAGVGIPFLIQNANKRCAQLDPAVDGERFAELAAAADILIDSQNPGGAAAFGTSARELADRFGHLVAVSVTDFGLTGPRASWRATDAVLYAMTSALSRTGPTAGTPVLPPDGVASGTAAAQAAWAALAAYYDRLRCGRGEFIDFSRFEGVLQALDPPFGSEGQASAGRKSPEQLWRGRPRNQQIYPIFACRDGHVRICLLSARQWRGMWSWLGEPAQFAGPQFDTIAGRYAVAPQLNAALAALSAAGTMADLVAEGQRRGVPVAAVLTPAQTLSAAHLRDTGALCELTPAPDATITVPVGPFVVDGVHRGIRHPATTADASWPTRSPTTVAEGDAEARPFDGVRILDLGVIVAGGELGRLFADLGAEVIKVESPAHPDGLRQTPPGMAMGRSWALTHRNEYSLGLDLRSPGGAEVFADLVAGADAVFANFKPGTLAALGFPYERLRSLNPRIVLAESSAFGDRGPWSARMGYGPLVRATTGVTHLWRSPDAEAGTFFDATTVFPDHLVGRITAVGALAALIRCRRDGIGAHVHVSQAEAAISQLATAFAVESARAAGVPVDGDVDRLDVVLPCAGDDEWCVVSVSTAQQRHRLAELVGVSALPDQRDAAIDTLSTWTSTRDKSDISEALQRNGIPAAPMQRAVDVASDPQVRHRALYAQMTHPLLESPILAETRPALFGRIGDAEMRPAPMAGEHTYEICQKVLGLSTEQVDGLIRDGALFAHAASAPNAVSAPTPASPRS